MRILVRSIAAAVIVATLAGLTATWAWCGPPRNGANWAACLAIHCAAAACVGLSALLWKLPGFLPLEDA